MSAPNSTIMQIDEKSKIDRMEVLRCNVRPSTSIIFIDLDALKTRRMRVRRTMRKTPSTFWIESIESPGMTASIILVTYHGRIATRSSMLSGLMTKRQSGMVTPQQSTRIKYSAEKMKIQAASIQYVPSCDSIRTPSHLNTPAPSLNAGSQRQGPVSTLPTAKLTIEMAMTTMIMEEIYRARVEELGSSSVIAIFQRIRFSRLISNG
mmetsp:Transcript_6502/g.13440  ORF Transcript_6502/g.13440 Transcript_6502/m.13440 type:complete len:207 (-) Transcript_6502:334-954(-)